MAFVDQISIEQVPRTIDPARHAMLDYGVAATYFGLWMKYRRSHRGAAVLAFINGAMVLGVSLFTDYPGGVWRKIPFPMHGNLDVVQAAVAGIGPAVMGFANDSEARAFYGQAVSEIGVIAATDWHAQDGARLAA